MKKFHKKEIKKMEKVTKHEIPKGRREISRNKASSLTEEPIKREGKRRSYRRGK